MSFGNCSTRSRCGNARTCDFCARERQRKIADQAEALEQLHGQLTLTVLCPDQNTPEAIGALRASFLRRACAPAGLWTVETGEQFNGLHINILSPRPAPTRWKNCHTYSELVQTTAREAAAYIAKRSGMPQVEQYAGRLHGTFGQLFTYLATQQVPTVVQAAAIEITLSGARPPMPKPTPSGKIQDMSKIDHNKPLFYNPDYPELCNPPLLKHESTREQRLEIMRRHLPNLYAAMGRKPEPEPVTARDWSMDAL